MQTLIQEKLKEIEKTENIRILHAVESGSRAWGFPSRNSDYDVRFIYVRPLAHYLKLEKTSDVIELPINDMLDINGWDLKKALQLLYGANPTLFEWMASPVVYRKTAFADSFMPLLAQYFSSRRGLYHYISMAEGNYREYLKGEMVRAKKYFYVLRPVLACRWILEKQTPPPMAFSELMESQLTPELVPVVRELLDLKMNAPEIREIPRIDALNAYLDASIPEIKARTAQMRSEENADWETLNSFFHSIVLGET